MQKKSDRQTYRQTIFCFTQKPEEYQKMSAATPYPVVESNERQTASTGDIRGWEKEKWVKSLGLLTLIFSSIWMNREFR